MSETQITNLLYRYAEYIDTGDLAGAASLFEHARLRMRGLPGDGTVDAAGVLKVGTNSSSVTRTARRAPSM